MPQYIIKGDKCELPHGTRVYAIPVISTQPGQLAMFQLHGDPEFIITGRWYPNIAGYNWIMQRKELIRDVGKVPVRILGVVIPIEAPPKEVTNLTTSEYVSVLLNLREVKG